ASERWPMAILKVPGGRKSGMPKLTATPQLFAAKPAESDRRRGACETFHKVASRPPAKASGMSPSHALPTDSPATELTGSSRTPSLPSGGTGRVNQELEIGPSPLPRPPSAPGGCAAPVVIL